MRRTISASIIVKAREAAEAVVSVAPAHAYGLTISESFEATCDGVALESQEIADQHGTRLHRLRFDAGEISIRYEAEILGQAEPAPVNTLDHVVYLRPSRYCESDSLAATAMAEFGGLEGNALLAAVSSWVGTRLNYVACSSLPTDGAVRTLLARQGVCRDFAHLCTGLLRARGVPARLVSVYAPGLEPMDFHAVCEAFVDGRWLVVDSTTLAPRSSMLRIATGRDAADTAFLSTTLGEIELVHHEVTATVDVLPSEDVTAPVQLR